MAKKRGIPTTVKTQKKIALPKIGAGKFTVAPEGKRTVLHIGIASATPQNLNVSFQTPLWHCIRVDSEALVRPDIETPCDNLSMIPDSCIDAIWMPQVLHKIYDHRTIPTLQELCRVLKEGGTVYISVPDAQIAGAYLAHNRLEDTLYTANAGEINSLDLLFGFRKGLQAGNLALQHRTAFTSETLAFKAREAGFTNIQVKREKFEIQLAATKYQYDNPKRVERIAISGSTDIKNIPIIPPIPAQPSTQQAPTGYRTKPSMMFDELDQPPFIWKDLGLKTTKK